MIPIPAGKHRHSGRRMVMTTALVDPITTSKESHLRLLRSGDIIRSRRKKLGLSHDALAKAIGVSQSYISIWETGKRIPSDMVIVRAARRLDLDYEYLRELAEKERLAHDQEKISQKYKNIDMKIPLTEMIMIPPSEASNVMRIPGGTIPIPVLGKVPGGEPFRIDPATMESAEEFTPVERNLIPDIPNTFALKVVGDSMTGRVEDGDIIVVQAGAHVIGGGMVVARIHDEVTVKAIQFSGNTTILSANKEGVEPILITDEYLDGFEIIGKVIVAVKQKANP
jgi:SOS-response transcriptional repressor LexA